MGDERIEVDIAGEVEELLGGLHMDRFKDPLEQWPDPVALGIAIACVAVGHVADKRGNAIFPLLPQENMEMIGHEDKSDDGHQRFPFCLKVLQVALPSCAGEFFETRKLDGRFFEAVVGKSEKHLLVVPFGMKRRLAGNAAIEDVVILIGY